MLEGVAGHVETHQFEDRFRDGCRKEELERATGSC